MLSGSAIREMLWMVLNTVGTDPSPLMKPVTHRGNRAKAIKELEAAGLVKVVRSDSGRATFISLNNISFNRYKGMGTNLPIKSTSATNMVTNLPIALSTEMPIMSTNVTNPPEPLGTNTPNAVVRRTWHETFPDKPRLSPVQAADFLKQLGNSVEDVSTLFERFKNHPKASVPYLHGVIRNEKKRVAEERTEGTISSASGSVNYPGWDSDEEYHAWQKRSVEAKALAKQMGYDDGDE